MPKGNQGETAERCKQQLRRARGRIRPTSIAAILVDVKSLCGDALRKSKQDSTTLAGELGQSPEVENVELRSKVDELERENKALTCTMQGWRRAFQDLNAKEPKRQQLEIDLRTSFHDIQTLSHTIRSMDQAHSDSLELLGIKIGRLEEQLSALAQEEQPSYSDNDNDGAEDAEGEGGDDAEDNEVGDGEIDTTVEEPDNELEIS